jgi:hypothetical protein
MAPDDDLTTNHEVATTSAIRTTTTLISCPGDGMKVDAARTGSVAMTSTIVSEQYDLQVGGLFELCKHTSDGSREEG